MGAMIEIKSLRKEFGPIVAVDGISLKVDRGEVLGFLGPNGAGKSTTMKMVTGYLPPTSGTAMVCGHDVLESPLAVKEKVGYLPEGAPLYPDMTPEGFLKFIASARGLHGEARKQRIGFAVDRLQLGGVLRQPIDTLSKGFKRRVGLAQAVLHNPEVLILDEPTDGLDPNQKHQVRELIREMSKDKCIVLSTHILEEVGAVCTRAAIVARGKLVADEKPEELIARSRYRNAVNLVVRAPEGAAVLEELKKLPAVASVEDAGSENGLVRCIVFPKGGRPAAAEVDHLARDKGWELKELHVEAGRLDEVFRAITAEQRRGKGRKGEAA